MRIIVLVLLIAVLAVAGLRFAGPIQHALAGLRGDRGGGTLSTPALADAAERKLECLSTGECAEAGLSSGELQSLIHYRYARVLPAFIDSTRIDVVGDRVRVRGRIASDRLPRFRGIGDPGAILPDTSEVAVSGHLVPLAAGRVGFVIDQVHASRIPVPDRLVPGLLRGIGRAPEPGLPDNGVALPLPFGAAEAFVRGDSVFLRGRPALPGE
jgi:hypothetical protein